MRLNNDFNPDMPNEVKLSLKKTLAKITSFKEQDFITRELFDPSMHLLNRKGKMLRPALVFLSANAMGERCSGFIDLAAAIELLHVSSLVHDDIIDKGRYRRGVKAVNSKYGNTAALLTGNALISKAIHLSARYGEDVMNEVSSAALRMCAGELMDYQLQNGASKTSVEMYLKAAELKTASLIGTSCDIVATYLGRKSGPMLYKYGFNIGMAFQIRDDVLDSYRSNGNAADKANIVSSVARKYGTTRQAALERSAEMNRRYIRKALAELKGRKESALLEHYAHMLEVQA
ncbi:MAG: polyprenyl synthetase family protein [Candidatus Micrarchaeaceae archaeon]